MPLNPNSIIGRGLTRSHPHSHSHSPSPSLGEESPPTGGWSRCSGAGSSLLSRGKSSSVVRVSEMDVVSSAPAPTRSARSSSSGRVGGIMGGGVFQPPLASQRTQAFRLRAPPALTLLNPHPPLPELWGAFKYLPLKFLRAV